LYRNVRAPFLVKNNENHGNSYLNISSRLEQLTRDVHTFYLNQIARMKLNNV